MSWKPLAAYGGYLVGALAWNISTFASANQKIFSYSFNSGGWHTWGGCKKKRIDALKEAEEKNMNCVIFDDGLQDYSMKYDLRIVCFNSFVL